MMECNKIQTFEELLEQNGQLVYTNKGVSMMPLLRQDRDWMIIRKKEKSERCNRYDAVLFKRNNGQYVLHRILKVYPDRYWIVGDHCTSGELVQEEQILGILTGVIRDHKTIFVTDRKYLFYVHLWCDFYPIRCFLLRSKSAFRYFVRICSNTVCGT